MTAPISRLTDFPFLTVAEFDETCQAFYTAFYSIPETVGDWTSVQLLAGVGDHSCKLDHAISLTATQTYGQHLRVRRDLEFTERGVNSIRHTNPTVENIIPSDFHASLLPIPIHEDSMDSEDNEEDAYIDEVIFGKIQ